MQTRLNQNKKFYFASNLMSQVISTDNLNTAFAHVRQSRITDSPNSDIWETSKNWRYLRPSLQEKLLANDHILSPVLVYRSPFMDDWLILTKSRTQLRRLVKKMHQVMHQLKFKLALDKTYIGKVENGFDFLGYRLNHTGIIGLAKKNDAKLYRTVARVL